MTLIALRAATGGRGKTFWALVRREGKSCPTGAMAERKDVKDDPGLRIGDESEHLTDGEGGEKVTRMPAGMKRGGNRKKTITEKEKGNGRKRNNLACALRAWGTRNKLTQKERRAPTETKKKKTKSRIGSFAIIPPKCEGGEEKTPKANGSSHASTKVNEKAQAQNPAARVKRGERKRSKPSLHRQGWWPCRPRPPEVVTKTGIARKALEEESGGRQHQETPGTDRLGKRPISVPV